MVKVKKIVDNLLKSNWNWHIPVNINCLISLNDHFIIDKNINFFCKVEKNGDDYFYTINGNLTDNEIYFLKTYAISFRHLNIPISNMLILDSNNFTNHTPNDNVRSGLFFAYHFLMPDDAIHYLLFKENITDITLLAERFSISETLIYNRLCLSGYLTI